jgi:hypothetical protein
MIRPLTRHCDECQHWRYTDDIDAKPTCAKGHTPRFYMPRWYGDDGCGFKRRCLDYMAIGDANRKEGSE